MHKRAGLPWRRIGLGFGAGEPRQAGKFSFFLQDARGIGASEVGACWSC